MLLLLFQAAGQSYGIEAGCVVEVVPVPRLRPLALAPAWLAGTFTYRGTTIPVVDLPALVGGAPARPLMSTRIAVVRYQGEHLLGIMADNMTETLSCSQEELSSPGVRMDEAPFLGDLLPAATGAIQRVTVDRLLPDEVKERLFPDD
ncbi:MAG TPA: chemotaxis protein CheW [Bryobacteraceae bacterium]|nr:chemotaxis protein CheW [Bryobacteraceae bacterium]HOL71004.1 chemotaxis protein CheW [Bryobacteraceae bacterium]HOQ47303.1 chemotaxis protein CheW [Bryobacteraceae bacterium]HPQ14998.1 chemotaxis protein CheW [Bryobacteraceae bacterium]HPU73763.1 chemotaxis protein CheW [Bryobacteraceae bacterium]